MQNSQLSYFVLFCFFACSKCLIIVPSILDIPKAEKNICKDSRIEAENLKLINSNPDNIELTPYIKCVNNAILKVSTAELKLSTEKLCPLQFLRNKKTPYFDCSTNNFGNYNVTEIMKLLCDGKDKCVFNFNRLPTLLCIDRENDVFEIPSLFTYVHLVYTCQTPRRRFRPFSNKRFDRKFTQNLMNPQRTLSFNNILRLLK